MSTPPRWLLAVFSTLPSTALAWPDADAWRDLEQSAAPLEDTPDDATKGSANLVGDSTRSVGQWYADTDSLYFRMRLDGDPVDVSSLQEDSWAVLIDLDGDANTFEYSVIANTYGISLVVWENSEGEGWDDTPETETDAVWDGSPVIDQISVEATGDGSGGFNSQEDYWLAFQLDRTILSDAGVLADQDVFSVALATTSNDYEAVAMSTDLAGGDNWSGSPTLADGLADAISIDEDGDGLTLFEEEALGTDPTSADTDGDGVDDGYEVELGTDPLLADSDGDGADDGVELEAGSDPLDEDSDDDGVSDGDEIEAGLDPLDEDSDDDGITDLDEISCELKGDEGDRDGDGIADVLEGLADTDEDGNLDFCDDDDDGDGIPTSTEGDVDTDGDETPNYLDTDSDEDGDLDADEGTGDEDCDEIANYVDAEDQDGPCGDPDEDGLTNAEEEDCGTDPDDPDTDDDGLLDGDEDCNEDSDGDGINDALDPDSNGDDGDGGDALDSGGAGNDAFSGGHYTGGSCSAAPLGSALLPAFLAGLAALRRRRESFRASGTLLGGGLISLLIPGSANAQELNAQRFTPAVGNQHFVLVEESSAATARAGGGLWFNYADDPLIYRYDDGTEESVLGQVATTDLVAWGRLGPVQLGMDLPLHLHALGHGIEEDTAYALGDLQLSGRLGLLDGPVSLGVSAWAGLPSGNGRAWLGEPGFNGGGLASLGLSVPVGRPIELAANIGFQGGASDSLDDLSWGSRGIWATGAYTELSQALDLSISAELSGELLFGSSGAPGAMPAEALIAFHMDRGSVSSTLGISTGLSTGVGSPDYRVVMGMRFTPDTSRDSVPVPEEGQTQTRIRIEDESAQPIAGARVELLAGPEEELGRWTAETGTLTRNLLPGSYRVLVEAEGYGALTTSLKVPEQDQYQAEPLTLFELGEQSQVLFLVRDSQGRVIDGARAVNQANPEQVVEISDGTGMITLDPGSHSWTITADGYQAASSPSRVSKGSTSSISVTLASIQQSTAPGDTGCLDGEYIRIKGTSDLVFFDTGEHSLRPDALDVLNSVAKCVSEHPTITQIEIIGHADPRGNQATNQELSERRAAQVKTYLETRLGAEMEKGLTLVSTGMGEEQLLQTGDSETALQTDRRVEFRVQMEEGPTEPAP
jgi:outer membrane protein OmpA-like peptidoglycan-associated protein